MSTQSLDVAALALALALNVLCGCGCGVPRVSPCVALRCLLSAHPLSYFLALARH